MHQNRRFKQIKSLP